MADAATQRVWIEAALARYERPLVAYARSLTGDLQRARDIVQETFLRLWQQDASAIVLAEWLFTVCRHLAIDSWRKERRMTIVAPEKMVAHPADTAPPDQQLLANADQKRLGGLLATLTTAQQEVVRLKFQQELSYKEIAHVMELSVSHVGVLLHQAMQRLRAAWKNEGSLQ